MRLAIIEKKAGFIFINCGRNLKPQSTNKKKIADFGSNYQNQFVKVSIWDIDECF